MTDETDPRLEAPPTSFTRVFTTLKSLSTLKVGKSSIDLEWDSLSKKSPKESYQGIFSHLW